MSSALILLPILILANLSRKSSIYSPSKSPFLNGLANYSNMPYKRPRLPYLPPSSEWEERQFYELIRRGIIPPPPPPPRPKFEPPPPYQPPKICEYYFDRNNIELISPMQYYPKGASDYYYFMPLTYYKTLAKRWEDTYVKIRFKINSNYPECKDPIKLTIFYDNKLVKSSSFPSNRFEGAHRMATYIIQPNEIIEDIIVLSGNELQINEHWNMIRAFATYSAKIVSMGKYMFLVGLAIDGRY